MIIGGGDTGADCLGHRAPAGRGVGHAAGDPADARRTSGPPRQPWPTYPMVYRTSQRPRGGRRAGLRRVSTQAFLGDGTAASGRCGSSRSSWSTAGSPRSTGTEREIPADLVLLAMGFTGPEPAGLLEQLGVDLDARGNVARDGVLRDQRRRACSSPATPGAASR